MSSLSKEAVLVHEALVARGLETPMRAPVQEIDNETRKRLITGHMTEIMQLLNLDLSDDSLMETPHRIAKMYVDEIFSGLDYSRFPKITVIENKMKVDEMVTVRDITLTSTCEHHFVTIDGKATVAYIPKDSVIGLSKINRIVQFFAQRPQVQERLTQQILIALQTLLGTNNVAVSIDAVHYCVKARGIRDATSATTTTSLGGLFKSSQNTRRGIPARSTSPQLKRSRVHGEKCHAGLCPRRRHPRYPASQYQRLRLAEGRLSQSRTGQEARPLAMPRTGAPRPAGAGEVSHPVRAAVWRRSSAIASAREALDPVAADAAGAARFHSRSFFSGMAIFCWPMPWWGW